MDKTYTLSKSDMTALLNLYTFAYDLLGGENAPEDGDAPEFKEAKKVLLKHAPHLEIKP